MGALLHTKEEGSPNMPLEQEYQWHAHSVLCPTCEEAQLFRNVTCSRCGRMLRPLSQTSRDGLNEPLFIVYRMGEDVHKLALTPDGDALAVCHPESTYLFDLTSGPREFQASADCSAIDVSPDGRFFAVTPSSTSGHVQVWDVNGYKPLP